MGLSLSARNLRLLLRDFPVTTPRKLCKPSQIVHFICKFVYSICQHVSDGLWGALPLSNSSLNRTAPHSFIHKIIPSPSFFLLPLIFFHSQNLHSHSQILHIFSISLIQQQSKALIYYNFSSTSFNLYFLSTFTKVLYLFTFHCFQFN
jgi:hypothetical protein